MIDDPEKTGLLLAQLKSSLPIEAGIPHDLNRTLAEGSPGIAIPAKCNIVDVFYSGDEGGVLCRLDLGDAGSDAMHLVSITHLSFDGHAPSRREIEAYQRHRRKKLKRQLGRGY